MFLASLAAGGTAATVTGTILTGVGSAWMKSSEEKEDENRVIREEERRQATYQGLGEATAYWKNDSAEPGRASEDIATADAVGKRTDMVGQQYKMRSPRAQTKAKPYTYDRSLGQIVQGATSIVIRWILKNPKVPRLPDDKS